MKKLLLTIALTACGGQKTFVIENEFSPEEVEIIHEAADDWVRATDSHNALILFQEGLNQKGEFDADKHWYSSSDLGLFWKISNNEIGYKQLMEREENDGFSGMAYNGNRLLIVAEFSGNGERFKEIVLHEFGHILGLKHYSKGLMASGGNDTSCIDSATIEYYCSMHECGPNARSLCNE